MLGSIAASLLGSVGGAVAGGLFGQAADAKAFERQKYMAANAHQLEVADLKAAGLNPVLSGMGGSGASASQVSNTVGGTATAGAQAGSLAARQALAEIDATHAQAEQARASAAASLQQANESKRRTAVEYGTPGTVGIIDPRTGLPMGGSEGEGLRAKEVAANIELLKQRAAEAGYSNVRAAAEAGVYKDFPAVVPLQMLLDAASKTGSAVRGWK